LLASLTLCAFAASSFPAFAQSAPESGVAKGPASVPAATADAKGPTSLPPATADAKGPTSLPPATADDGAGLRTAGYVAGGVGLVGLALFAIAGLGAKSTYDKLESDCGSTPCTDPAHQSDIEQGRMLQTLANIGLAAGLTGLGVSATLLVIANNSSAEKRMPAASLSPNGGMITLGGKF
jgi:hypothetical protein